MIYQSQSVYSHLKCAKQMRFNFSKFSETSSFPMTNKNTIILTMAPRHELYSSELMYICKNYILEY